MKNTNLKNNTRHQVLAYIQNSGMVSPVDIGVYFDLSRQMTHRHLKHLVESAKIKKIGTAPKVLYAVIDDDMTISDYQIDTKIQQIIDKEFFFIEPTGTELSGIYGFEKWCYKRKFDISKKAQEFKQVIEKYQKNKKNGLLDATHKINKTFGDDCCVSQLFYFEFYAVEIFGRTRMGQKLFYAKQGKNRGRMKEIAALIRKSLMQLIELHNIDSVVFVPPTVPREIQFMKVLEMELALSLASIKVEKVIGDVRVPQKTLKKLSDRIENAEYTFRINSAVKFKKTLIIDDAVGSGASINQIACKLKKAQNTEQVIGFAVTGSLNDFEVLTEV
ncbi:hypothetical protein SPONN_655 [uncultured Candidatus Thioglobus sp.]|nr:hypothetical protein SPONN_655 [uncultured Candidatus Thioglobus sp.]